MHAQRLPSPPGPRGLQTLQFFGGGSATRTPLFLESVARQYGPVSSFRVLGQHIFLLDEPEWIGQVLVTRQHSFRRDNGATLLRELVGDGLLTREEPQHRERRRVMQPAFHAAQVAGYAGLILNEARQHARQLA